MSQFRFYNEDASTEVAASSEDAVIAEAEVASLEGQQEVAGIETMNASLEDAVAGLGELEQQAALAQETLDDGTGMSEQTARAAEVTVESVCRRLSIPRHSNIRLATESFGRQTDQVAATRLFVEDVGATVKAAWQKLKDFVASIFQRVKDFLAKFFTNTDKVAKNLQAAKDKVSKVSGKAEKSQLKLSNVAKGFNVKGKAGAKEAVLILGNQADLMNRSTALFDGLGAVLKEGENMVAKNKMSADEHSENIERLFDAMVKAGKAAGADPVESGDAQSKKGYKMTFPEAFNGAQAVLKVKITKEGRLESKLEAAESKEAPSEVPTLKVDEMSTVLEAVRKANDATADYKKVQPKIETLNKEAIKLIDQAIKVAETVLDGEPGTSTLKMMLSDIKSLVSSVSAASTRMASMLPAHTVAACNCAIAYVNASCAEYKKA